ncbi:SWIM zinc finger family protein [Neobacillus sp. PS3-40]|uniref:SWIM zinc finger family protein n=1 Tax=Neobacillus sp. PS3-40 TaxID=3070679 RepID=UPI0027E1B8AB|nr:SWIM zinc finger family protein [Neobacillus sp. PS3-40]WML46205.1 SWIM zinc finger family protein [Neobacillus sp. PS3-40]
MESISASEQLQGLADEMRELLNPHVVEDVKLIQKGMMLYRQGMVWQLKINGDVATAAVQDVIPVRVELDLNFLGVSECTCPSEGFCRHLMAAFFAAYSRVGSVSEWMEKWREPVHAVTSSAKWGMERARDLVKANGVMKPDYERWVQSFEESFDTLLKSSKSKSPYIIVELFGIYHRRIRAGAPMEQEWRLLYELIGNVFTFKKLAAFSEELGHTEEMVKRSYLHLFQRMIDETEDLVFKIGLQTHPFAFDVFMEKFKNDSSELLTCARKLEYERIYLYRHLWTQLFKNRDWREGEGEKIASLARGLQDWENPIPLLIGGIHQNVMLGNDDQALGLMGSMEDQSITPYMLFWIDLLSQQKAWRRIGPMIELFSQKIKRYMEFLGSYYPCSSFTRLALKAVQPYCTESKRIDLFERMLLQTLPYSFHEYEYMLFDRRQFDRWGELHSFIGFHYTDLPKDRIKLIEKEQPEVLLALLHQSAQHEISLKNRSSYKVAVRHLKKLRTLYKKLKRLDEWQFFFDTLMEKTKRLRAFHEECRRSKLLDA